MPAKTSRNLTIVAILGLVASAITLIAIPLLDGDPATQPNIGAFGAAVFTAVTAWMAKGEDSTGGTVIEGPVGSRKAIEAAAAKKE